MKMSKGDIFIVSEEKRGNYFVEISFSYFHGFCVRVTNVESIRFVIFVFYRNNNVNLTENHLNVTQSSLANRTFFSDELKYFSFITATLQFFAIDAITRNTSAILCIV